MRLLPFNSPWDVLKKKICLGMIPLGALSFLPSSPLHTLFFLTTDSTAQYQLKQFAEFCRI